ncbi:MAG: molybdopterin molybdotransferase MoeA [Bacteroidota bacterium]|nr:molybdopterin molybdotransferase MoeA [Bacteroidota bacterium]
METFITPAEAHAIIHAQIRTLPTVKATLLAALGRFLQEDIIAQEDVPPFDNSAMDGFALCVADLSAAPVTLKITGEIAAGDTPAMSLTQGSCVRIMTGAPVPDNTAAVVPVEWTRMETDSDVRVTRMPAAGQFVRAAGRDLRRGATVLEKGVRLTPPALGLLATAGHRSVRVSAVPRVTIVVTGDELFMESGSLPPGKIRDANGPALAAQVQYAGGSLVAVHHARDDKAEVADRLDQALHESDVILFSGGVSVGNFDYVNEVFDAAGVKRHFWRVKQRPGGPLSFGMCGAQAVFGLPGNPVSSFVCFEQYVRPAMQRLMAAQWTKPELHRAVLREALAKTKGLHHFIRGIACRDVAGQLEVRTTGPQASNLYSSAAAANCLIHLPQELEHPFAGQEVDIEWLPWAVPY